MYSFGGIGGLLAPHIQNQYQAPMMGQGMGAMMHGAMQQPVRPFGGPAQMFRPVAFAGDGGGSTQNEATRPVSETNPELDAYLESRLDGGSEPPPKRHTEGMGADDIMARTERRSKYYELRMQATNDYRYNRITKEEYDRRLEEIERGYGDPEGQ